MAQIIYEVVDVKVTKGMKNSLLKKVLESATKKAQEKVAKTGGGAFQSASANLIQGKNPRYKVVLVFLRFSPG